MTDPAEARAREAASVDKSKLIEALGEARAEMIERLDLIHARTHPGPWHAYQDGVHPIDVGMAGAGDDYAICGACFGPRSGYHQLWICASHNDWPMIRECLEELAAILALSPSPRNRGVELETTAAMRAELLQDLDTHRGSAVMPLGLASHKDGERET